MQVPKIVGILGRAFFVFSFFIPFVLAQIFEWDLIGNNKPWWLSNLLFSPVMAFGIYALLFATVLVVGSVGSWIFTGGDDSYDSYC